MDENDENEKAFGVQLVNFLKRLRGSARHSDFALRHQDRQRVQLPASNRPILLHII